MSASRRAAASGLACALASAIALGACGGGGDGDGDGGSGTTPPPAPPGPTTAERSAAAKATAESTTNACSPVRPFYWEIGDATAALASGSITSSANPTVYTASSEMAIASASKWIYSTYLVEKRGGVLSASDVSFLTFTSGYVDFGICLPGQTVGQCAAFANNDVLTASAVGKFSYGGGHMQNHAAMDGLAAMGNDALAAEMRSRIGSDIALAYGQPQLAGGAQTTAADYAKMLRRILGGTLRMKGALGTHAVCTNPATCATALRTPVPSSESWHYSIGHWVEDDPVTGDGAFSSPGAFGFYPWIDATKTTYGVLARKDSSGGDGIDSVYCGRLIRAAWKSGVAK